MTANILIALGSNRRHRRHGAPEGVVRATMAELTSRGLEVVLMSRIRPTAPMGPGGRRFANAAVAVRSELSLAAVLAVLKSVERDFGRRGGRRWGDRVLDLDIIGAGAAVVKGRGLQVPHPRMAERRFVLDPLVEIAPDWRHPLLGVTARQLRARAMRPKGRFHVV
ncbi:hypothetical protein GCM10011529_09710 [Polymorphobacter glacialis]|uniref:2-amino-4-hydroxy-6-hydroxymethyldihydropteridine pyrophosphokinase n=1 Tax=Sandarakinorhabdus glacialis TaxID=1614636 RepID=A0A916ZMR9_9SPHN|nr:2-amino-4-hydroxy-6-hydroxymethyldihydropteridine diphosphokinase [Polymorphobacter glacialis]GGE05370.1 hypothetical protein GCM10011529_09710 [Polymorphobacter glacialis]